MFIFVLNCQAYLSLPNSNQVNERLRVHVQIRVGAIELLLLRGETTTDLKNIVRFYQNYGQKEKMSTDQIIFRSS